MLTESSVLTGLRPQVAVASDKLKESEIILATKDVSVYYGDSLAVSDINLDIPKNQITALIGPSGCGKSTLIRCFNRLNDLIPSARVKGKVTFYNCDLYDSHVDAAIVRRYIGMVFQKPNPFPDSIYDNIAYGAMICGFQGNMDELVERSLRRAALWDEVKDILSHSGLSLSGGQQQRLCIARAIAVDPEVVLMDEPCSSLDPITTSKIEDLMRELKEHYTIVIVTHNMQQAARISDMTAFFNTDVNEKGSRYGYLVEYDTTHTVFDCPNHEATQAYISGQFG